MNKRKFGRTGLETSILGFGGFHLLEIDGKEAEYLLNRYLDAGGNYIETAASYGAGESEIKIGRAVAAKRKEYILVTKTEQRDKQGCLDSLHNSLKNLKAERADLLMMHSVGTVDELNRILGENGAMEGVRQAQKDGELGFVGISMHGQPAPLIKALQVYPFDAVMSTINYYDRFNYPEIENELIPLALEKETAIILMKPVADGLLWQSAPKALRYAMSQPVSVVVAGMNTREILESDLKYAESFEPMTEKEKEDLYANAAELGSYVCRQCGKCLPCPENIDMPLIFKYEGYFDRQMRDGVIRDTAQFALRDRLRFWFGNSSLAKAGYGDLKIKADSCTKCGECIPRCPYNIDIIKKLALADYKLTDKKYF